jgi:hypothetical protein
MFLIFYFLGVYINELEGCLEEVVCMNKSWVEIVIIIFLYVAILFLWPGKTLNFFCFSIGMTVSTNKTNVMIIKSKKIPCANFMYDNNNLEEVSSYKYLKINLCRKLNWNYRIEKRINEMWKSYYGFETIEN